MALFKSKEERRIERDIKIRQGIRRIEKSISEQRKFSDEFVKNARHAKQIGDMGAARERFITSTSRGAIALPRWRRSRISPDWKTSSRTWISRTFC